MRCLTKDTKARLRDIGEARIAIDEILGSKDAAPAATGAPVPAGARPRIEAVPVQTTPEVRLGAPRNLFERRYSFGANLTVRNYSLSRDGKELLLVREESGSGHLSLIFNWLQNVGR